MLIQNVTVHRGVLLLRPENVQVVGGFVASLVEMANKVNKEAKKRYR